MAWQGGRLTDGHRCIAVPETMLRSACLDLLIDGFGRLRIERVAVDWAVSHLATGEVASDEAAPDHVMVLRRPGRGGQLDGRSVLDEAAADQPGLKWLAARAAESAAAGQQLAEALAGIADDLLIPLTIFSQERVDRVRFTILAQSLYAFCHEIHRLRTALREAMTRQAGPILDPDAPENWRFEWTRDWRAECAIGEAGGWGPVYQVFRRHGIILSPLAHAFTAAQAAAAGYLTGADLDRRARYFGSASEW